MHDLTGWAWDTYQMSKRNHEREQPMRRRTMIRSRRALS
jgi:hypothetical protein